MYASDQAYTYLCPQRSFHVLQYIISWMKSLFRIASSNGLFKMTSTFRKLNKLHFITLLRFYPHLIIVVIMSRVQNSEQQRISNYDYVSIDSAEESQSSQQTSNNITSRLLDLAVSASYPRGGDESHQSLVRHLQTSEIPRQMTRAMSQITRLNAQRTSTQQRWISQGSNQIAMFAESFLSQQRNNRGSRSYTSANLHPSFRSKPVCTLLCKFCDQDICQRGMKAILLADTKVCFK